eukprot:4228214-Amphidinium_carterae.1
MDLSDIAHFTNQVTFNTVQIRYWYSLLLVQGRFGNSSKRQRLKLGSGMLKSDSCSQFTKQCLCLVGYSLMSMRHVPNVALAKAFKGDVPFECVWKRLYCA